MKKTLLLMTLIMSVQANAVEEEKKNNIGISSSSGSLYSDVECDMTDYTCNKIIMDLGRQEAIAQIVEGRGSEGSAVLKQAIQVYKKLNPQAKALSDDEIIYLLVTEQ